MSDVTKTNDHASNCKSYAVSLGYYEDPYIKFFARNPEKKQPEINLGTYVRATVVRLVASEFVSIFKRKCNIISLGAGFDTLFWNLDLKPEKYVEVDLQEVVTRKAFVIDRSPPLKEALTKDAKIKPTGVTSENFHLMHVDISGAPDEVLQKITEEASLDKNLPVLFLSECVLIYLEIGQSQKLIDTIPSVFKSPFFLLYEQVNVNDKFGRIMINSIRSTYSSSIGEEACSSLLTQEQRFLKSGSWSLVKAKLTSDLSKLLAGYRKAYQIEKLDEEELLEQLLTHYCFLFATNHKHFGNIDGLNYIKEFFL